MVSVKDDLIIMSMRPIIECRFTLFMFQSTFITILSGVTSMTSAAMNSCTYFLIDATFPVFCPFRVIARYPFRYADSSITYISSSVFSVMFISFALLSFCSMLCGISSSEFLWVSWTPRRSPFLKLFFFTHACGSVRQYADLPNSIIFLLSIISPPQGFEAFLRVFSFFKLYILS